jgi:hypothetical protein
MVPNESRSILVVAVALAQRLLLVALCRVLDAVTGFFDPTERESASFSWGCLCPKEWVSGASCLVEFDLRLDRKRHHVDVEFVHCRSLIRRVWE